MPAVCSPQVADYVEIAEVYERECIQQIGAEVGALGSLLGYPGRIALRNGRTPVASIATAAQILRIYHPGGVTPSCHPGGGWLLEHSDLRYVLLTA